MHEAAFIDLLRGTPLGTAARGLTDDAAVLGDLVLTHDMMVEGTHYFAHADPADVAWKLVARNLSDLAAKGATPLGVLLGYMLGDDDWDRQFALGLQDALSQFGTELWGGDTAAGPAVSPRVLGLTAIGRATHLPVPSRSGARAGDNIWIAGTVGDAYIGWRALTNGPVNLPPQADDCTLAQGLAAFNRPVPRLADGCALAPQVTAMMDISDGVLLDARRMAMASAASFSLDLASLPYSATLREMARAESGLMLNAATFGDDYALLFTLPAAQMPACAAQLVGRVLDIQPGAPLLIDGAVPDPAVALGWQHRDEPG